VRVSLVAFTLQPSGTAALLNGEPCTLVNASLSGVYEAEIDICSVTRLAENSQVAFQGVQKSGAFDIPGDLARYWLKQTNPNGRPNSDVLGPTINGRDLANRISDVWIINFSHLSQQEAALYDRPFQHVLEQVKPQRDKSGTKRNRQEWWKFERPRLELFNALITSGLDRYLGTCHVSKHRFFAWIPKGIIPQNLIIAVIRGNDETFGVLNSLAHEIWALRMGTWLGKGNDPRYTASTTFQTFPFPEGLTPNLDPADYSNPHAPAIAEAARALNDLRERWLNPPELVKRIPEVVPGYPDRILPVDEAAAKALKKRTLTNLYNARPAWLDNAHKALDAAVAAAYGWTDYSPDLPDDEILSRLLRLNLARSAAEATKAEGDIITGRPKADA
jgi:type II restriction/modification system DNA methylase subunit YeeA